MAAFGPVQLSRGTRCAAVVIALAGSGAGIVSVSGRGALPPGLPTGRLPPPAIDGVPTGSWAEAAFEAQRHSAGHAVEVAGVGPVALVREVPPLDVVLLSVSALAYAVLAGVLSVPRPRDAAATRVGLCLLLGGLAVSLVGVYPARTTAEHALALAYVVVLAALPVAFLELATTFPHRHRWRDRAPWLMPVALLAGLAVAASGVVAWDRHLRAPTAATFAATRAPTFAGLALLVAGMATGCVALAGASRAARSLRERSQARWLLWGIAVAAAPFVLLRALPRLLVGAEAPMPTAFARAVELAAPASFAAAVARHRMLDIDVVIRRSLLYTGLAVVLVVVAAAVVVALGGGLAGDGEPPGLAWAAAGLVSGALFVPARRAVSAGVDRAFFRIRSARRDALRDLSRVVAVAPSPAAVGEALARMVGEALDATWCAVVVRTDDELVVVGGADPDAARRAHAEVEARRPVPVATVARGGATAVREIEGPGVPDAVPDARMLQPVVHDARLLATILVGPRRGGRHHVAEDVALLRGAGACAADALDRLRLVRVAAEREVARRALADLDRRRTDFLLRVAHDLRSPLTAVRWSVDNLLDGLSGPLTARQAEDLAGARAALRQLGALVENVLSVSRMAVGADLATSPVDAATTVRDAVEALAPLARVRGVRVALDLRPVGPVRARRDGLLQVAQNLVDNAIKHAPVGSDVDVRLAAAADGGAVLSVRDRGPGIPREARATLFERFRASASGDGVPGAGLGIGLHVVRAWVEAFGGGVDVLDPDGGGAELRVRLVGWEGGA